MINGRLEGEKFGVSQSLMKNRELDCIDRETVVFE